jgi:hypothetical protein
MVAMVKVKCQRCRAEFEARVADRKRGWGKFCSKSCKAVKQEKRTHAFANFMNKDRNFRGSGVSKEQWLDDQREHGGTPQYDRRGNYVGFVGGVSDFDNTSCQNSDPNE